jgi:hypothetical protein
MILNVVLAGTIVYGGMELRGQWLAAKAREAKIRSGQVAPAPAPPFTKLPEVAPVMASGYANVAQKFLLDPSRNPDLPIEVPPPPPPPKPMPPLPFFHGMMNIGNGPEIILSLKTDATHKRVHAGEPIGEFTLVAFNSEQVELQWNDQRIVKSLAELSGHSAVPQAVQESAAEAPIVNERPPVVPGDKGPGTENAAGERACQEGDTDPPGTERDGVVKIIGKNSLFGTEYCIWRPKH